MNANPDKGTGMEIIIDIDEFEYENENKDEDKDKDEVKVDPLIERKIKFLNNDMIGFKEIKLGFYQFEKLKEEVKEEVKEDLKKIMKLKHFMNI